jgi:hypothetical protein
MTEAYIGDLPLWSDPEAQEVLDRLGRQHRVPAEVLEDLVNIVRERLHQERPHGINDAIAEVLAQMDD